MTTRAAEQIVSGEAARKLSAQKGPRALRAIEAKPVLITGGAGFIGSNLAQRLMSRGERVLILDNLSRPGVDLNLRWLRNRYPTLLDVQIADVRDFRAVLEAVSRASHVFHFAAQVAVT